jgi:hypothetical protein
MRMTAAIAGLGIALAGSLAFGQAALPAFYSGPWSGATLPTGWTQNGLGSDYATNYDGVDGNAAKFDGSGDWLQIHVGSAPSTVSYFARGNSLSGEYTYKVQESANGSTWTDVVTYNTGNPLNNSAVVQYTNNLLTASRYVRFIYVTKAAGNVGLDGVRVQGPGVPSVVFDPSGSQSIAVSNELALAVSITPNGSGMQSWSLLPAYQGSASLVGGNFTFTPATGDDVTQNFTLRVVATNSVGTTTGQVAITVTAYTPPMPVVAFHPAGPYAIMATETQRLGVAVTPAGSGMASWELTPSNYAGTATLIGTNFTFATAEADGPETYTLTVVATNVHGATTGTASIVVAEYAPPPPPGSVVVDFEDGPSKTSYAIATNTLSGRSWLVGGVIGTLEGDKKFDLKALRIRCNATDSAIKLSSLTPFTNGIGSVSLWFASYGNDGTFNMPQVSVQISTNLETGWVTLDTFDTGSATELTYWSRDVNMKVPVYFRLWSPQAGTDRRANIDNLTIAPYVAPTGYEAFLLSYNVTPGDPGTAEGDDLDGDGWTNQQEYLAGTNPYDPAVHP